MQITRFDQAFIDKMICRHRRFLGANGSTEDESLIDTSEVQSWEARSGISLTWLFLTTIILTCVTSLFPSQMYGCVEVESCSIDSGTVDITSYSYCAIRNFTKQQKRVN